MPSTGLNSPLGSFYLIPPKFDEVGITTAPILCVREPRLSKGLFLAQDPEAHKRKDMNPGNMALF